MPSRLHRGVTLAELLVALIIVATLAVLAVPTHRMQLARVRRAEARAALLSIAAAQESHHYACRTYARSLDPAAASSCDAGALPLPTAAADGAYEISIVDADASYWSATATVLADGAQRADEDCRAFGLDSQGRRTAHDVRGRDSSATCWRG